MSRPEPSDDIQTVPLFPPARGLFKPYRVFNPFLARGNATTCLGFRIQNSVIRIMEGMQGPLDGQDNVLVTPTAPAHNTVRAISSYRSTTRNDIIYIYGDGVPVMQLRVFPLDNSGAEATVVANMGTDIADRVSWVRFRNKILFATTNNGLWWYDPEARTGRKAGVVPPATNATGAVGGAGALTGNYQLVYTNVNDQGHESNPSAVSAVIAPAGQSINWASIDVGPTGTTSRRLYRTATGGATYLFLATIADNVTVVYADNNADATLGAAVDSDNTVPDDTIRQIFCSRSRVYLIDMDGLTVWASKIDATTGLPNWEAYPSKLSLDMAFSGGDDKAKAGFVFNGDAYVFGGLHLARIVGDVAVAVTVEQPEISAGLLSPYAWDITPLGPVFINNLKQLILFDGATFKNIGKNIQGYLDDINTNIQQGLNGPEVRYDPLWNCLYISCSTAAVAAAAAVNNKTWILDMDSSEFAESPWNMELTHYSEFFRCLYGATANVPILGWWKNITEGASFATSNLATARLELFEWSPSPGDDIDFLNVQFLLQGTAKYLNSRPEFYVEYSLDGGAHYRKTICEYDKAPLLDSVGESPMVVSVVVPIYQVAKFLTLRITVPDTTAVRNSGLDFYAIQSDVRVLYQNRDEHKGLGEGKHRVYH